MVKLVLCMAYTLSHRNKFMLFAGSFLEVKNLDEPVVLIFPIKSRVQFALMCRYWTGSHWSDDGVVTSQIDDSTVQCSSTHLTSFAVFGDRGSTAEGQAL